MEKSSYINRHYFRNLTYIFIIIGFVYGLFVIGIFYLGEKHNISRMLKKDGEDFIAAGETSFNTFFLKNSNLLLALENSNLVKDFILSGSADSTENLQSLFLTIVSHDQNICQLRLLSPEGMELIRADRPERYAVPFIVSDLALQDKSDRYYFEEIMKKKKGEVYISDIDLNIEHEEIELPFKPMIRFGLPVFVDGKPGGVLVINFFAKQLLNYITYSNYFWMYLTDGHGRIIYTNDITKENWENVFHKGERLDSSTLDIRRVLVNNFYLGLKYKTISMHLVDVLTNISIVGIISIVLSLLISFLMSRVPLRLFDKIEMQHKVILQQSRSESKSELLSSIAHRWRQPLNEISLSSYMMRQMFRGEKFEGFDPETIYASVTEKIQFLSETIDMFTDKKGVKGASEIRVVYEVMETVDNLRALMIAKSIWLDFRCKCLWSSTECNLEAPGSYCNNGNDIILGQKEDFKQVIFSLIMNAKDAVLDSDGHEKLIYINITVSADKVDVVIGNKGRQIPEDLLQQIFEPYFTTKEEGKGSGIGLYVAKMIIEDRFGGKIWASNAEDGVEFSVSIPKTSKSKNPAVS